MDIIFTNRDELIKVCLQDVMYIKADGNYAVICMKSGRSLSLLSSLNAIKQLLDKSDPRAFVSAGRSHIVNMHYVSQIHAVHKTIVVADDNTKEHITLHVSRESITQIMEAMKVKAEAIADSFETKNGNMRASAVNNS